MERATQKSVGPMTRHLPTLMFILIAGASFGAFYSMMIDQLLFRNFTFSALPRGAVNGMCVALAMTVLEYSVLRAGVGQHLQTMAFVPAFAVRSLFTAVNLLAALTINHALFHPSWVTFDLWVEKALVRDFMFAAGTACIIQFALQAKRLIGGRTLAYFLMGRYAHPVQEKRIFLLADLVGSTAMAERLGDEKALQLMSRYFLDLDPAIYKHGGVIHNYVGDEIVMSWKDRSPRENSRVLRCITDMFAITHANRQEYIDQFGVAPTLRVGMAAGQVAAGECGWQKRQVVYVGDAINIAKRLQEACKPYRVAAMTDAETLKRMEMPTGYRTFELGRTTLRGRETETLMTAIGTDSGPYSLAVTGN